MFTGIVEAVGKILHLQEENACLHFSIALPDQYDLKIGESIAVNGVCLTVTSFSENSFQVTVVPETLRVTNLALLRVGDSVNVERSMLASTRLGGHYVQGHVDAIGEILEISPEGKSALLVKIGLPSQLTKYIVKKGYIAIDGMSLTVIDVGNEWFTLTLIPHTQEVTVANQYHKNKKVNIEVDILSKYIEKLMGRQYECNPTSNE